MAKDQAQQTDVRRALGNAYAAILSRQATQTFFSFTFEDAIDLQLERLEGKGTKIRPNEMTRLERLKATTLATIEQLKALPPEAFKDSDPTTNVNTKET